MNLTLPLQVESDPTPTRNKQQTNKPDWFDDADVVDAHIYVCAPPPTQVQWTYHLSVVVLVPCLNLLHTSTSHIAPRPTARHSLCTLPRRRPYPSLPMFFCWYMLSCLFLLYVCRISFCCAGLCSATKAIQLRISKCTLPEDYLGHNFDEHCLEGTLSPWCLIYPSGGAPLGLSAPFLGSYGNPIVGTCWPEARRIQASPQTL